MPNTEGFGIANAIPRAGGLVNGETYLMIEAIKNLLVAGGWSLIGATIAAGWVYVPGWATQYIPTIFIIKSGFAFQTLNDIGTCKDCGTGAFDPTGGNVGTFFGVGSSANDCANGFWDATYDCGHDPWDDTAICDGDGNIISGDTPHNGNFTGTFDSFATAIAPEVCQDEYKSRPKGFDRDVTPILSDGINVYIEAKNPGPYYNSPKLITSIGVGFSDGSPELGIAGGGYRLRSQVANGRTQFELLITQYRRARVETPLEGNIADGGIMKGQISIRVKELYTNSEVEYIIDQTRTYNVITNPYTLYMAEYIGSDTQGSFHSGGNSFLATAPYNNNPNLDYCLIVIGPGSLIDSTVWLQGYHSFAINGPFVTEGVNSGVNESVGSSWPGIMCRNPTYDGPLLTTKGNPLAQTAWVMGSYADMVTEATILGVLWNSFILSKTEDSGSRLAKNGIIFWRVSGQTLAPECSLWMADGSEIEI